MQQNRETTLQKENQQITKKVWSKPEIEVINTDYIQNGSIPHGQEGQLLHRNGTIYTYNGNS